MYAQLGEIRFEALKGFSSLSDKKEALYAEHALIDGKPRLQRTGNALDEFTIGIKFHVSFCDPEAEYDALNRYRDDGEVLPLIYGTGYVEGNFVITSLNRTVNDTSATGEYIDIDVSIGLKEFYQPDLVAGNQKRALLNAFAVSADRPTPENVPVPPPTPDTIALNVIKQINSAKTAILEKILVVTSAINNAANLLDKGQAFADNAVKTATALSSSSLAITTGLSSAAAVLNNFPALNTVAPGLGDQLDVVSLAKTNFENSISAFIALPAVANDLQAQFVLDVFNNTVALNTIMQAEMEMLNEKSSPLKAFKALRKPL
jgi:phage protein U